MSSFTIAAQRTFWNQWNATHREHQRVEISLRQAAIVQAWLKAVGRRDLDIIDVGCGAGWLCPQLTPFGRVTGTDLSDEVLARARQRAPEVRYIAATSCNLSSARAASTPW